MSDSIPSPVTVPAQTHSHLYEVKRSRFLAVVEPFPEPHELRALLARHHQADASHHCWAWRCNGEYRFSDDGEPAGTAGRPILQALDGAAMDRVLVVVVRHFGGIKLGAGGLVRAYGTAAAQCLARVSTRRLSPHRQLHLQVPFAASESLFQLLGSARSEAPEYTSEGVAVTAWVAEEACTSLIDELNNRTRGGLRVERGKTILA